MPPAPKKIIHRANARHQPAEGAPPVGLQQGNFARLAGGGIGLLTGWFSPKYRPATSLGRGTHAMSDLEFETSRHASAPAGKAESQTQWENSPVKQKPDVDH